ALGATNGRIEISWAQIEKVRGKYDWTAADRLVRFVTGLGLTPVASVSDAPDWARGRQPHGTAADPLALADLGRFGLAVGKRYKGQIEHWEFMPEPDRISGMTPK